MTVMVDRLKKEESYPEALRLTTQARLNYIKAIYFSLTGVLMQRLLSNSCRV